MRISRNELPDYKKQELKISCFDIIGVIQRIHSELGPAMVEYVYQEALFRALKKNGYDVVKEYVHHPQYDGEVLEAAIKMDLVIFRPEGNVIIECKSIVNIGDRERLQTYGYLCGTQFPFAILANFGTYPKAQIERYYFSDNTISAF